MPIDITLKLDAGLDPLFEKYVFTQLKNRLRLRSSSIKQSIEAPLKEIVRNSIMSTPEYRSLLGGKLQGELGVPFPLESISNIIDTWVENISVTVKVSKDPLLSIHIGFLQQGYGDVLSLPDASYEYERGDIPWLEWLLLEGDKRIVRDYVFRPIAKHSRTGLGIMVSSAGRAGWQVPAEFSGTETNNFATRAFDGVDTKIEKIVKSVIKANL
jgi:hypothetical protein